MSKTWKWILGILAVLLIVAVVVGGVFIWRTQMTMMARLRQAPRSQSQSAPNPNGQATPAPNSPNAPAIPNGYNDRRYPMGGWGNRGPMMGGRGFSPFGGFMPLGMGFFFLGGLLRLIIPLGVLVLVAIIFYAIGRRAGASAAASTAPPTKVEPSEAPQAGRKVAKS